jgi:hypothetical protein
VLIAVTALFLGRAHYVIYVLKRSTKITTVITWLATLFVIGFWTWQWVT